MEDSWKKIAENFLSFRRPSAELNGCGSHNFGEDQSKTADAPEEGLLFILPMDVGGK